MNRLYVAEPTPTATGSVADHRQPLKASQDGRGGARHPRRRAGRRGAVAGRQETRRLRRRRREGPAGRARQGRGRGGLAPAGSGPRRRARDQSRAWQHRHDGHRHRPVHAGCVEPARRPEGAGAGPQRRRRAPAGDSRRQPGLQRPGRPEVRRRAAQGPHAGARRAVRRRDGGAMPLARQRHALPRGVERRARARWHRLHRAAAHRAALPWQVVPRGRRGVQPIGPSAPATSWCASTGRPSRRLPPTCSRRAGARRSTTG